jgi:hypothetical protein
MELVQRLCLHFCPYYKSSKNEELACRGYVVVQSLIENSRQISFHNRGGEVRSETVKALVQKMCKVCRFHKEDCDFILKGHKAPPCGGFLLLGHLVDEGTISIDDIGKME